MISLSVPTRIGFVQPHSLIEAAIPAICSLLCVRGFVARGIRRSRYRPRLHITQAQQL